MRAQFRSITLTVAVLVTISTPLAAQYPDPAGEVYTIDNPHSIVDFTVRLVGFQRVRGEFREYWANLFYVEDDLTASSVSFVAETSSVDTGNEDRNTHLKSADFFDAERLPFVTFTSTSIEKSEEGFVAVGELTIKETTREVRIPFVPFPRATDPFGNERIAFEGIVKINRRDYDVIGPRFWNNAVSNEITIEIEVAARVWAWDHLGWGSPDRLSIGKVIFDAIEADGIDAALAEARSVVETEGSRRTHNLGAFEWMKIAGRRVGAGHPEEAVRILELALEFAPEGSESQSALLARVAGAYTRLGRSEDARVAAQMAISIDAHDTFAQELLKHH